jgi:hypothetical protein
VDEAEEEGGLDRWKEAQARRAALRAALGSGKSVGAGEGDTTSQGKETANG